MKTKRSKATDIPMSVKQKVWERDKGMCVVCGNNYNVMPNAHFISRSKGGLGIEQHIVTLCTQFTQPRTLPYVRFGITSNNRKIFYFL